MTNKDSKLIYTALGSLMLVLLQSNLFQDTIAIVNILPIPLPYLFEISHLFINILSFSGLIIFIITSLKLIVNNIKNS